VLEEAGAELELSCAWKRLLPERSVREGIPQVYRTLFWAPAYLLPTRGSIGVERQ
jgi:hypothetical protein